MGLTKVWQNIASRNTGDKKKIKKICGTCTARSYKSKNTAFSLSQSSMSFNPVPFLEYIWEEAT